MSGSSQITNDTVDSLFGTLSQEEGIATPQSTTTALATPGRPSFMTGALPLVVIPAVKSTTQPAKDESPRKAAFPEAEKSVYGIVNIKNRAILTQGAPEWKSTSGDTFVQLSQAISKDKPHAHIFVPNMIGDREKITAWLNAALPIKEKCKYEYDVKTMKAFFSQDTNHFISLEPFYDSLRIELEQNQTFASYEQIFAHLFTLYGRRTFETHSHSISDNELYRKSIADYIAVPAANTRRNLGIYPDNMDKNYVHPFSSCLGESLELIHNIAKKVPFFMERNYPTVSEELIYDEDKEYQIAWAHRFLVDVSIPIVPDSIQRMFKKSINKAEFSCNSYDRAVFGHLKEFLLKAGLLGEYNFDETHCSSLNASQQIDYLKTQLRGAYLGIHRLEQDSWENSIQQSAPDSRKSGRDKRELSSLETNHHPKPTIQTPNAERDSPTITNHTPVTQATKVESNPYSIKKDDPNHKADSTAAKPKRNREDNAIKLLPEDVKEMSNLILQNHCIKCKANFHSKTSCKDEVSEER